ncbi:glycosyltransferase family 4 protein [Candidatus Woesearchaeota archaeon]|nr:glycosyltransferase family 4 protein [Candidatus Woesearchaeota archaeon]
MGTYNTIRGRIKKNNKLLPRYFKLKMNPAKLKVLIVTSKFPRFKGDSQPAFPYYLSKELANKGIEVHVVAPHGKGARITENLDGIHVHRFKYFFTKKQKLAYGPGIPANLRTSWLAKFQMPFFVISQLFFLRKITKLVNPDIIHVHWAFPQGFSAMFASKPYIVTIYGGEVFLSRNYKLIIMLNKIIKKSCCSFAITNGLRNLMYQFGVKSKVGTMPLGVDMKKFHPNIEGWKEIRKKFCKKDELMVLCVGRLVEKKGIHYLLPAFAETLKAVPNLKLVVVGDGYMHNSLVCLSKKLGIDDKVIFTKEVGHKELPKYYCASDLFVLPSIIDKTGNRETQGVVYLEAMACKTPVIGTDTGGIPDVISNEKVGMLVPQKNTKKLAGQMISMLKNKKLRKSYAENAYKHVISNFKWKDIAEKYISVYKRCIKR